MLMLHQTLPHLHHEHGRTVVENSTHHHHSEHSHGHDHSSDDKDEGDKSGFLGFLLADHSHTYHSNDFEVKNTVREQVKNKKLSAFSSSVYYTFLLKEESTPKKITAYRPPGNFDFYISTISLRGPPVLG